MPARTVQCLFSNQTNVQLSLIRDEHEWGDFTDPWYPPKVIPPMSTVEWRSESDGVWSGTEGTAYYSIAVADGGPAHFETVRVFWDNPFSAHNSADLTITQDFSGKPSEIVEGAHVIDVGDWPVGRALWDKDVESWVDTVLFLPYLAANASSKNDTRALYAIRMKEKPVDVFSFDTSPPKKTYKINKDAKADEWIGTWTSAAGDIAVTIARGPISGLMVAQVTDSRSDPTLQFSQDFQLGAINWVALHLLNSVVSKELAGGVAQIGGVFKAATSHSLEGFQRAKGALSAEELSTNFRDFALKAAADGNVRISDARVSQVSKNIGGIVTQLRFIVTLMNGISLTLYDYFVEGKHMGAELCYARYGVGYKLVTREMLSRAPTGLR